MHSLKNQLKQFLLNKSMRTLFSFLINLYFVKMTAYVLHFKYISVGLSLEHTAMDSSTVQIS